MKVAARVKVKALWGQKEQQKLKVLALKVKQAKGNGLVQEGPVMVSLKAKDLMADLMANSLQREKDLEILTVLPVRPREKAPVGRGLARRPGTRKVGKAIKLSVMRVRLMVLDQTALEQKAPDRMAPDRMAPDQMVPGGQTLRTTAGLHRVGLVLVAGP